jgi:hypothetical protein
MRTSSTWLGLAALVPFPAQCVQVHWCTISDSQVELLCPGSSTPVHYEQTVRGGV